MKSNELSGNFVLFGYIVFVLFLGWGLINYFFLNEPVSVPIITGFFISLILVGTGKYMEKNL